MYQGDTFMQTFRLRYLNTDQTLGSYMNLTDSTAKAQMRTSAGNATVVAEFTATIEDQSTMPGGITISLTHTATADIDATTTTPYVWDLQLTDVAGRVTTYLAGSITVLAEVTR